MKRAISVNEIYPYYDADPDIDDEPITIDLTEKRWAEYDSVMSQFDMWQNFLEKRYEAKLRAYWDEQGPEAEKANREAWRRVREGR